MDNVDKIITSLIFGFLFGSVLIILLLPDFITMSILSNACEKANVECPNADSNSLDLYLWIESIKESK